jgi:hypothetical protein
MPDWEEVDVPRFLKEAQAGNVESFSEIYTQYAEGIFRFLFLHLDNRLDAEDLTGEVFYRPSASQYQPQGFRSLFLIQDCAECLIFTENRDMSKTMSHWMMWRKSGS